MSARPACDSHVERTDWHFVIVGAGAIGCYLGGQLASAGERVTFVGRPAVVAALRAQGLLLSDLDGNHQPLPATAFRAVEDCSQVLTDTEAGGQVCVLLCVKTVATADAAAQIAAVFGGATPVVCCQNGVESVEQVRRAAPELAPVAAMVPFNVVRGEQTHVRRTTEGALCIGLGPASAALVDAWRRAGLAAELHEDMQSILWGKLLLNLNNPVNALSNLPLRDQLAERAYRVCLAALQREALAVLRRASIRPARLAALNPTLVPHLLRLPDSLFRVLANRMLRIDPAARSSMWDDLRAGRPTEIDCFCGAVVRLGQQVGVPTPCNERMLRLISEHRQGESYDGHALRKRLRA